MASIFNAAKDEKYHGVRGLAEAANRYLSSLGNADGARVSERTIRYYITEGLFDHEFPKHGVTSVFGYEHLLTLLVIRKLQTDRLPISFIRTLLAQKTVDELEKLLGEDVRVFGSRTDLEAYRTATGHTDDSEVMELHANPGPDQKKEARAYLESLLFDAAASPEAEPPAFSLAPEPAPASRGSSDWRRYEIVPGVELHVARRFRPGRDANFRQRILLLIDGILQSRESK
jgi:DNA-binding transcriptional MerR regulator